MEREEDYWTSTDLKQFFRFDSRGKSINSVYNAEKSGEIPTAERQKRGKVSARIWPLSNVPKIGNKFGFLPKNNKQIVICKYIQKGGVLKTTTTFNEARTLALNGIKTLVIGLDFECSITDIFLPSYDQVDDVKKYKSPAGLYHFIHDKADISDIIKKTNIPTLDIIPETHDLVLLDKILNTLTAREEVFKRDLLPGLKDYDVIIFDNGPSWNHLIENAVFASDVIISPLGCNLLSYNASKTNFNTIREFQRVKNLKGQQIIAYATLLERSSLSQQIYGQYLSDYSDYIIPIPIRASVKGQESLMSEISILEYMPKSALSNDYYELIIEMWKRATKGDVVKNTRKSTAKTEALEEI